MAKIVEGTDDYSNGAYEIPDSSSNGAQVSKLTNDAIIRLATHTHSGADSAGASLPSKVTKYYPAIGLTFIANGNGLWTVELDLLITTPASPSTLTTLSNTLNYYAKPTSAGTDDSDYSRIYPTETFTDAGTSVTLTVNATDLDIKVIG